MSFNPETYKAKLAAINETQESITSLSQWIMFHKRHAAASADVWAEYTAEAPVKQKLALVYLANEVVQQCRARKRDEFVQAFARVVADTLEDVYAKVDKPVKDRIARVVKVWAERSVFAPDVQEDIEGRLGSESALAAAAPELVPATKTATQYIKSRDALARAASKTQTELEQFLGKDGGSALASLQKITQLEHMLEQTAAGVTKTADLQTAAVAVLRELADTFEAQQLADFAKQRENLELKKAELLLQVGGDDEELPSPNVEPSTPEADEPEADEPEADEPDADEYVPSVYTAKDAEANYNDQSDDDNDNIGYAASSDDEPEAKKAKLDLDPKLASFLASMAGK